ncbi:hypothetical protein TSTA_100680 [Talaromyces stipitatus ATCC 10500]|uniref:Uncharacterized protein n=1 Tax=Talaromyces stipitatus (strain ATCC 10500 / CBS 375.48 / QM 6759 / NRRL 1006) TaxID=441959 RepID=B8MMR8_TALSN|nr:uncharacterized protein TSTA_100680 [Talaromyces stipitatus ATCC 10500]EED13824.1 hypothetical protein TSTA_100680 [Talaromyces stipitatus ATCC 10500]
MELCSAQDLSYLGVINKDTKFNLNGTGFCDAANATRKYENALAAIAKYHPTSETATALDFAVKAQPHAAHSIPGARANSIDDDITGNLEIGEDPEHFVVHLVSMHKSESGQSRKEWIEELKKIANDKLKEASRVKALLKIIRYAMKPIQVKRLSSTAASYDL